MELGKKSISQYVVVAHYFNEVMKLPSSVKITSLSFDVGISIKRHSLPVNSKSAELGVTRIKETLPSLEVEGKLTCSTREEYKKKINELCELIRMKPETVRVKTMKIKVGESTATLSRTKKQTKEGENTKRHTMLGIFEHTGNLTSIVKALSAEKFTCKYELTTIRTVLCSQGE